MTISTFDLTASWAGAQSIGANKAIQFPIMSSAEILIEEVEDSTQIRTTMQEGVNYTISLTLPTVPSLGTLSLLTAISSGYTWEFTRNTTIDQQTDYVLRDKFSADSHESALDKITLILQEIAGDIEGLQGLLDTRYMRAPIAELGLDMVLEPVAIRAGKFTRYDDITGQPVSVALSDITTDIISFSVYFLTLVNVMDGDSFLLLIDGMKNPFTTEGDLVQAASDGITAEKIAIGASGQVLTSDGTIAGWATPSSAAVTSTSNVLFNANFRLWNRSGRWTFGKTDASYIADRWKYFSEDDVGGTNDEMGSNGNQLNTPDSALLRKEIYWWIIPPYKGMIGQVVSFQEMQSIRAAGSVSYSIDLGVQGTSGGPYIDEHLTVVLLKYNANQANPDNIPNDWVATWELDGVTPIWATNWSLLDSIDCSAIGNFSPYTTFSSENVTVPANTDNLALCVLINSKDYTGVNFLRMRHAMMVPGPTVPTEFYDRPYAEDVVLCNRYYQKTFASWNNPVQHGVSVAGAAGALLGVADGDTGPGNTIHIPWYFSVPMRTDAPTITTYNPRHSDTINTMWNETSGARIAPTIYAASDKVVNFYNQDDAVDSELYIIHATAEDEI